MRDTSESNGAKHRRDQRTKREAERKIPKGAEDLQDRSVPRFKMADLVKDKCLREFKSTDSLTSKILLKVPPHHQANPRSPSLSTGSRNV